MTITKQTPEPIHAGTGTEYQGRHVNRSWDIMVDAAITCADCTCGNGFTACPRHEPNNYTAHYARHTTDGIGADKGFW